MFSSDWVRISRRLSGNVHDNMLKKWIFTQFQRFDNNTYHAEPRACLRSPFCRIIEFASKRFLPPSSPPSSRLCLLSSYLARIKNFDIRFQVLKTQQKRYQPSYRSALDIFFVLMELPKWERLWSLTKDLNNSKNYSTLTCVTFYRQLPFVTCWLSWLLLIS